jgi:hypothetical protein
MISPVYLSIPEMLHLYTLNPEEIELRVLSCLKMSPDGKHAKYVPKKHSAAPGVLVTPTSSPGASPRSMVEIAAD